MSGFVSRPTIAADPFPFYCIYGRACRHSEKLAPSTHYEPRPEFNKPHPRANPILVAFREFVEKDGMAMTLRYFDEEGGVEDRPKHIDHARRVIDLLTAVSS